MYPDEQSISFPVLDAAEPRDTNTVNLKLEEWFVAQLISFAVALQANRMWHGSPQDVQAAINALGNQVIALMVPLEIDPMTFDPSFEVQGDDLYWRYNDQSAWQLAGNVRGPAGADGQTPQLTVDASSIAHYLDATATIDGTHITFGIPRGEDGTDGQDGAGGGLWTPPAATTEDQMCTAAKILADTFADRLQDNIELIDSATTTLAQALDSALDALGELVPVVVGVPNAVLEFSFEGVVEVVIDWVRVNAYDLQARALARDQIYCAMLDSQSFDDFWDHIDWLGAAPSRDFDFTDPLASIWDNFGDWMQWAFDIGDGTYVGWLILAWGAFLSGTVDHLTDADNSAKNMAAYALNTASFNDQADCSTADCQTTEYLHLGGDGFDDMAPAMFEAGATDYDGGSYNAGEDYYYGEYPPQAPIGDSRVAAMTWTVPEAGTYNMALEVFLHATRTPESGGVRVWHNTTQFYGVSQEDDVTEVHNFSRTVAQGDTIRLEAWVRALEAGDGAVVRFSKFDCVKQ